jgi:glucose dehydrogenase
MARNGLLAGVVVTLVLVLGGVTALPQRAPALMPELPPISDDILVNPNPNDWLMWRRTYNAWGHSPLSQITAANVSRLRLAWAWTHEPGNQEAAPLVHRGVMYLAQSNNVVHALDARTGDLLWQYRHPLPKLQGTYVKRQLILARNSIALYQDKVYLATGDARLLALDARTGKVVWNVAVADYNPGFNYTSGPLVAKGKIIVGIPAARPPTPREAASSPPTIPAPVGSYGAPTRSPGPGTRPTRRGTACRSTSAKAARCGGREAMTPR